MLTAAEALALIRQYLGDTSRAAHSRVVGALMRELAGLCAEDTELWEVVGLCHDLDFFAIGDDWSRHGLLATQWLAGRLPDAALEAIAAQDHRTGVQAGTLLADMLKVADVVAIVDQQLGRGLFRQAAEDESFATLRRYLEDRPYLGNMLQQYASKHGLMLARISALIAVVPEQ